MNLPRCQLSVSKDPGSLRDKSKVASSWRKCSSRQASCEQTCELRGELADPDLTIPSWMVWQCVLEWKAVKQVVVRDHPI